MATDELRWTSLADDAGQVPALTAIERDVPPFLGEFTAAPRERLATVDPSLSWVVAEGDLPVAAVRAARLRWDGTLDDAPAGGVGQAVRRAGEADADTLAVLDVSVAFGARGRGVGAAILRALPDRTTRAGLARTLVLVRPHAKATYPLVPFARYLSFTIGDGRPFDPWVRAAWTAGLIPVRGVDRSLVARADVASFERWLGVVVPGSGPYLLEGAIKPAIVEVERDEGRYREPHLWMTPRQGPDDPRDHTAPTWGEALAAAGVVAGDRAHREVRRRFTTAD